MHANGVFLPTQPWKELWDLWILGFILYSAVMVPYRICFSAPAEHYMFWLEQGVTVSFIIDVCFSYNTAYMEDERWVVSRSKIAIRYMQGWFWIDFPSSLPIEFIDSLLEGDSTSLGMLRFLRLFRLLRLLRLLKVRSYPREHAALLERACKQSALRLERVAAGGRVRVQRVQWHGRASPLELSTHHAVRLLCPRSQLGEYIAALEIRFDLNLTFLRICQMVLQLIFLAHILGCFWFYIASLTGIDHDTVTWVSTYDDGSGIDAHPQKQYLYSLYWALTTLTTVRKRRSPVAQNVV